jgi:hypothetical protein
LTAKGFLVIMDWTLCFLIQKRSSVHVTLHDSVALESRREPELSAEVLPKSSTE